MNPQTNMLDHPEEEDYLYRPLFEVISLKKAGKKKKKKKGNEKWVQRLYQNKVDYSQMSSRNHNQSMYGGTSMMSESTFLNPSFAHGNQRT